jgi:hypothetical protein
MSKRSIFWAVPVVAMLTGCAVAAKVNARHDMEASKAAYKAFLDQHGRDLAACEGLRQTYEADLSAYRATSAATRPGPVFSQEPAPGPLPQAPGFGQPVISSEDCIGAVVNGVCHGTPAPGAPTATCNGRMVRGVCTGPMFRCNFVLDFSSYARQCTACSILNQLDPLPITVITDT